MKRRVLLGLLAASPLAFLLPRTVRAEWKPGSQYKHFGQLFDEMVNFAAQSPEAEILSFDNPLRVRIGFLGDHKAGQGEIQARLWEICPTQLPRLIHSMPDSSLKDHVRQNIGKHANRALIAKTATDWGRLTHDITKDAYLKELLNETT